jgi:hypothetical protein
MLFRSPGSSRPRKYSGAHCLRFLKRHASSDEVVVLTEQERDAEKTGAAVRRHAVQRFERDERHHRTGCKSLLESIRRPG